MRHIPTDQILNHFKTATAASVNGTIYKKITVDDEFLTIGPIKFPLDYFDIGGINRHSFQLLDSDKQYRDIMLLKEDGYKLDHPAWDHEEYLPEKVRNLHLLNNFKI